MSIALTNQTTLQPVGAPIRAASDTVVNIVVPPNANGVIISAEAQPLRFVLDGTATATLGLPLAINTPLRIDYYSRGRISVIGMAAAGFVNYQFFKIP